MADNKDPESRQHLPTTSLLPPDRHRRGLFCQTCGKKIPPGGLFYIARTEIICGSDGILPDITSSKADSLIREAMDDLTHRSETELMDEVYQEIKIILCGGCRLEFRQAVLALLKY
jgi:hypothetical protein